MGTRKKLVLPDEIPFLETDHDLDVTIDFIECESYAHTGQRFHLAGPKIPAFSPEL